MKKCKICGRDLDDLDIEQDVCNGCRELENESS
jgi:hypothetical protein